MDFPIIDCDIHPLESKERPLAPYLPANFRDALRQGAGNVPANGYQNPFGVIRRDAQCLDPVQVAIDLLDRYSVAYAVMQPPGIATSLAINIDAGSVLAHGWNEWQIGEWFPADPRYLGSLCVNMNDPARAVAEIRTMGANPRMCQVVVCGESRDLYGHRSYFPIYEACEEMRLPLAMHPGNEGCLRSSTPIGRPTSYFEWHSGIPLTYQAHLISMITEGVFEQFPGLKVILVEGGVAWLAHTMWRMDKNFKSLRSSTPWLKRSPSETIRAHVRLTTQPLEEPENPDHLLQIFEMVHAEETLCYASDFPHWDFDDPRRIIARIPSPELKHRIFYANAAELYGLPAQQAGSSHAE